MLLDCFTFYNEYDMLEGRLRYLNDVVDKFIIVEGDQTFSGITKPYNYIANIERFKKYQDKIVYIPFRMEYIDYSMYNGTGISDKNWIREFEQRKALTIGRRLFPEESICLLGDIDEIPNNSVLTYIKNNNIKDILALSMDMFYFNFNYCMANPWCGTIVFDNNYSHDLQSVRGARNNLNTIRDAGWHLSYWGNIDFIKTKIKGFAHQEFNNEQILNSLQINIENNKDIFNRNDIVYFKGKEVPREIQEIFGHFAYKGC